jgi:hypothetical protein
MTRYTGQKHRDKEKPRPIYNFDKEAANEETFKNMGLKKCIRLPAFHALTP